MFANPFLRRPGTSTAGTSFSPIIVQLAWEKATVVLGYDSSVLRKDACGAWIARGKYGSTEPNGQGWEIDHIQAVAHGGADDLSNLQPLQWQNNRAKSDNAPTWGWSCAVAAR